ncbi:MAG TPA: preprotein translocase subunit SecG [Prevotellaceae bacterium]|nr:preprotein translocase subunit SecG [Prevotellaceae bacterium]HBE54835.1 preprotein translocase subunit SecG [Prevotellaceae bacterium]
MYTSIVILAVLASVLMCLIVLVQESKGGGLAADYSSFNQMAGAPKTTNFIEKATWGLAAAMIVLSVLSVAFLPQQGNVDSVVKQQATEQQATNPGNVPAMEQPSATQQEPAKAPDGSVPSTPAHK